MPLLNKMSKLVSPTGYIELDNDTYSLENKSTRSRETVVPKEDLAFYFNTYIVPKYGLNNINVSNVASFMKDLEMNWSKLTPDLKDKVLDILVDHILIGDNYDFKNRLFAKLNKNKNSEEVPKIPSPEPKESFSKSTFGNTDATNMIYLFVIIAIIVFVAILIERSHKN